MPNYDFHQLLSWIDFEILSRDLLQKELNITLESFKSGADLGIDFRYCSFEKNNTIIIQCKNYKDDFNYFFSKLKNEFPKIQKINPSRYIVTTSVGLSPQYKNKIKKHFEPYIISTSDIYGKDDLNNLLGIHNDIEKDHFKLWLSSTNILESIINKQAFIKTEGLLEEIERDAQLYVQNDSYKVAKNILKNNHYCIISGNAGVGKSTLAKMLILNYITYDNDVEIIELTENIKEAYNSFDSKKKQVFYYDDFLGRNLTNKLVKNECNPPEKK